MSKGLLGGGLPCGPALPWADPCAPLGAVGKVRMRHQGSWPGWCGALGEGPGCLLAVGPGAGLCSERAPLPPPPQDLVNIEMFLTAKEVEESLERRETATCLAWCHDNKSRLRKMKVPGAPGGRAGLRRCHLHLLVGSLVLGTCGASGFGAGF